MGNWPSAASASVVLPRRWTAACIEDGMLENGVQDKYLLINHLYAMDAADAIFLGSIYLGRSAFVRKLFYVP